MMMRMIFMCRWKSIKGRRKLNMSINLFLNQTRATPQDIKLWDSFQDPPAEESSGSSIDTEWIETLTKVMKIFTYWLVFFIVAFTSVLSKLSFLLMTSNVAENSKTPYCDIASESTSMFRLIDSQCFGFSYQCRRKNLQRWFPKSRSSPGSGRLCLPSPFRNVEQCWGRGDFASSRLSATLSRRSLASFSCSSRFTSSAYVFSPLKFCPSSTSFKVPCWPTASASCHRFSVRCRSRTDLCVYNMSCPGMLSRSFDEPKRTVKYVLDVGSIVAQLIGFFIWPLTVTSTRNIWFAPLALLLVSCRWWENFVTKCSPLGDVSASTIDLLTRSFALPVPIQYLAHIKDNLHESRYKIYSLIAPYKVLLFFTGCVTLSSHSFNDFFVSFSSGFGNHTIRIEEVKPILNDKLPDFNEITSDLFSANIFADVNAIWWILLTHVASSYICYIFGKFACKIHIQTFSFSLPTNLTVPLAISSLIILCGLREANICVYHDMLPDYMFFHMPPVRFMFAYIFKQFAWIWIFWLLSQTWVTRHLWNPRNLRNASTERLFVLPMYDSLIIDQSMAFNRRREEFGEFIQNAVRKETFL